MIQQELYCLNMKSMLKPWTYILPLWLYAAKDVHIFRIFSKLQQFDSCAYIHHHHLALQPYVSLGLHAYITGQLAKKTPLYLAVVIPIKVTLTSSSFAFTPKTAQLFLVFINLQVLDSKDMRWQVYLLSISYIHLFCTQWFHIWLLTHNSFVQIPHP